MRRTSALRFGGVRSLPSQGDGRARGREGKLDHEQAKRRLAEVAGEFRPTVKTAACQAALTTTAVGGVDTDVRLAVEVRQIAAELDPLAAHAKPSTAKERQETIGRARNEVVGPLAHRAGRECALDEPNLVGPLRRRSAVPGLARSRTPVPRKTMVRILRRPGARRHALRLCGGRESAIGRGPRRRTAAAAAQPDSAH